MLAYNDDTDTVTLVMNPVFQSDANYLKVQLDNSAVNHEQNSLGYQARVLNNGNWDTENIGQHSFILPSRDDADKHLPIQVELSFCKDLAGKQICSRITGTTTELSYDHREEDVEEDEPETIVCPAKNHTVTESGNEYNIPEQSEPYTGSTSKDIAHGTINYTLTADCNPETWTWSFEETSRVDCVDGFTENSSGECEAVLATLNCPISELPDGWSSDSSITIPAGAPSASQLVQRTVDIPNGERQQQATATCTRQDVVNHRWEIS